MIATELAQLERIPENLEAATLVRLFDEVCAGLETRTALSFGSEHMTYAQLRQAAHGVASGLLARGIGRGDLVGICLDRGCTMIVAMLGVIKSGAGYLPMDVRYPAARLQEIVDDAKPALVIVELGSELAGVSLQDLEGPQTSTAAVQANRYRLRHLHIRLDRQAQGRAGNPCQCLCSA